MGECPFSFEINPWSSNPSVSLPRNRSNGARRFLLSRSCICKDSQHTSPILTFQMKICQSELCWSSSRGTQSIANGASWVCVQTLTVLTASLVFCCGCFVPFINLLILYLTLFLQITS